MPAFPQPEPSLQPTLQFSNQQPTSIDPPNPKLTDHSAVPDATFSRLAAEYETVLEGRDRLVKAYNDLGLTYYRQGNFTAAREHFQKILEITPELPRQEIAKVYFNIGTVFEKEGDTQSFVSYIQKALELEPDFQQAKLELLKQDYKYQVSLKGYQFDQDWFSEHLLVWQTTLQDLAERPGLEFLEIGSWEGRSTCWLLDNVLTHANAKITCIDTFKGSLELQSYLSPDDPESLERKFDTNIAKSGAATKVKKIVGLSQQVMRSLPLNTYDFVYIDGSHLAPDVLRDAVLSWDVLKMNGILIFDDYNHPRQQYPHNPKLGIDAFLACFEPKFELLHQGYQVVVKKLQE